MTQFRAAEPFWQAYARLPDDVKAKARAAFRLFQHGATNPPFHPSLRIRKMQGHPNIWEGHISLQYVFTFIIEENPTSGETIYVFRRVGTHTIYRQP